MRYGSSQTEETACPRPAICPPPIAGKRLITDIKAMRLDSGFCLVRIDTDAGVSGYGECGDPRWRPGARLDPDPRARAAARLPHLQLVGKDPLDIGVHHHNMFYAYRQRPAHIMVCSGLDMALWDLAGKLLGQPVHKLLGGAMRTELELYSHCPHFDLTDAGAWAEAAADLKADPHGFRTFKVDIH